MKNNQRVTAELGACKKDALTLVEALVDVIHKPDDLHIAYQHLQETKGRAIAACLERLVLFHFVPENGEQLDTLDSGSMRTHFGAAACEVLQATALHTCIGKCPDLEPRHLKTVSKGIYTNHMRDKRAILMVDSSAGQVIGVQKVIGSSNMVALESFEATDLDGRACLVPAGVAVELDVYSHITDDNWRDSNPVIIDIACEPAPKLEVLRATTFTLPDGSLADETFYADVSEKRFAIPHPKDRRGLTFMRERLMREYLTM